MRDLRELEKEMFAARTDLEDRLAELRRVVRAKLDLRARARVALAKRPLVFYAVILGGLVLGALAAVGLAHRRRDRRAT